jgi:hypothetical protein
MEVAGMVLHSGVRGGDGAAVVSGGNDEVLQPEWKKRGEVLSKKERGGDLSS